MDLLTYLIGSKVKVTETFPACLFLVDFYPVAPLMTVQTILNR